jgi:hypothetical protein
MKKEGALTKRFLRHNGIYRSDVSSLLFTPGPLSRFPVGPVPGYRASRKAHALPIVRDEFWPAIPRRVARQHCPSPLHRHFQDNSYPPSAERIYHRVVDSVLTVCLSERGNPIRMRRHLSTIASHRGRAKQYLESAAGRSTGAHRRKPSAPSRCLMFSRCSPARLLAFIRHSEALQTDRSRCDPAVAYFLLWRLPCRVARHTRWHATLIAIWAVKTSMVVSRTSLYRDYV